MMITGNSGRALVSAKTPRPLNIGIRRSVMTRSNRFSESASLFATATGSETPVTCMPSLASTLVIARSIPGSSSTTKTDLSCNSSIIFSKNSTARYGTSPRCSGFSRKPIQPNRADYRRIAGIARAQRSHCQSGRAPGHPSREARRQQVQSRYCPLTTRKIIHKAKNNCQRHSRGSRGHLRSRTKLSPWIHLELTAPNFDKTVRNFVHGSVYFQRDQNHYPAATSTCQTKTGVTFVRAKLEKSLAPVNSHSPLSAGLFGHHLFFAMAHGNTIPFPQGVAKVVPRAELH